MYHPKQEEKLYGRLTTQNNAFVLRKLFFCGMLSAGMSALFFYYFFFIGER